MAIELSRLKTLPEGLEAGGELIAEVDECFLLGFARLGPAQHQALERLTATFGGTPLGQPIAEAADAVKRSEFLAKHFVAIAAGRAAIQGAQYDALRRQSSEILKFNIVDVAEETVVSPGGDRTALSSSAQQWLMELALAGFKHVSMETLAPFMATLEQMQADPGLSRMAALLTGFLNELLMAAGAAAADTPIFRWVDLWTRAMVMTQRPPALAASATVSGIFYPLGVDVRSHSWFVNIHVYGLLEVGKTRRIARAQLSSYKVDVIGQNQVWHLFRPEAETLLESLASAKRLNISGMQLFPSGDLIWTGKANLAEAYKPMEKAAEAIANGVEPLASASPLTRHPVQLSELVYLEKYSIQKGADGMQVTVDGVSIPLDLERLGAGSELNEKTLESSSALVGLLRFDSGRWALQPICARSQGGKKESVIMTGSSALQFCKKDKSKTLATLSERASKLLRE